ncbi:MAG: hypothetical protein H3C34_14615 [Caldilineaceae bacterium]|nr:hypothetical protein [Caldilineaceae bacterium]
MLDYNHVLMARIEHERRIQELARARSLGNSKQGTRFVDRLLYRVGELLENAGGQLKAHHQVPRVHGRYQGSHAN